MLSTTRSRAVWLLSTEIFGLESTRTFPKDSSNWRTPEILVPLLASTVKMLGNPGVLGSPAAVPVWVNSTEVKPRTRKTDQSIAEVLLNNQYQQGIDWSVLRVRGLTSVLLTQTGTAAGLPSTPGFPSIFTVDAKRGTNISGVLQLLESFGNVRVLSSPKISVLNNQTALLRVVDNIVYFNVQVTVVAGNINTLSTTATNTTPVTVPVGFVMNVTPQISEDRKSVV